MAGTTKDLETRLRTISKKIENFKFYFPVYYINRA